MKSRMLESAGSKTYAVIFETGDEVASGLKQFAQEHRLGAAHFTAIGALEALTLGYFDWDRKDYKRILIREQVEVLSLVGDVTLDKGEASVHAHIVVGKSDGTAHGGHLLEAQVRPTLEVMLVESPAELRKSYDPVSRLDLIDAEKE